MRRRLGWLIALSLLVLVAVGGWLVGRGVRSPEQAASEAAPPLASWITAAVERRVLTQTIITRGDVAPEVSIAVGVPLSVAESPVVTSIDIAAGTTVSEGTRMVEVSGRPVFVMQGAVPVFRSLRPGMKGADVAQVQAALGRLGCDTAADAGVYGTATKACVATFYRDAGYEPVASSETEVADVAAAEQAVSDAQGQVDNAQIALDAAAAGPPDSEVLAAEIALDAALRARDDAGVAADAAVVTARAAAQRAVDTYNALAADPASTTADLAAAANEVDAAHFALDEAERTGETAIADADDAVTLARAAVDDVQRPPDVSAETAAVEQASEALGRAQGALDALRAATGPTVPQGEIVFAPSLPARVERTVAALGPVGADSDEAAAGGQGTSPAGALATLASGDLVVEGVLRPDQVDAVRVGTKVELLDEQTDATYTAAVAEVAATATAGPDGQVGHAMTVATDAPLPPTLSGANVRVTIATATTSTPTLVVPLAAVSSSADGITSVSVLPPGAIDPVTVEVTAGLSADGSVSVDPVEPGALADGDAVVVGR